jgi:CheY-like chemotaxis protein
VLFPVGAHAALPEIELPLPGTLVGTGLILVVDDEAIVRETARAVLERYGYTILFANNGAEGLESIQRYEAELAVVVLDLNMPVMNGEEALRVIRSRWPQLRVMLTSGFTEQQARSRFGTEDLAGFVQKPYTPTILARKVKEVLQTPPRN